ncbi:MAG: hypothetical protein R3F59_14205 [Myxococcota bacterium]
MGALWLLAACGSTEPAATPAPVEPPPAAAPARSKGAKGKGAKGKGKRERTADTEKTSCGEGVLVNGGWEGEYPSPIPDVREPVATKGRKGPCQPEPTVACTVPPGLYHPWAEITADFRTVRGVDRYRATRDLKLDDIDVSAGTEVWVTAYHGEGYCSVKVGDREAQAECPGMFEGDGFEEVAKSQVPRRQLVRVACTEGAQAWIDADALMKLPGVREGEIVEFGKVGPAKD